MAKHNINIQLLTPVHIGSGEVLEERFDYFVEYEKDEDGNSYPFIGIIDPRKILEVIGEEQLTNWVSSIERKEDPYRFVKRINRNVKPESITRRIIFAEERAKSLKECMQTISPTDPKVDRPIIPGSSIKGAIRTALLAASTEAQQANERNYRWVERNVFGADPQSDVLRFLRVGDAFFAPENTYAYMASTLNYKQQSKYNNNSLHDSQLDQLIEAIPEESKSSFTLSIVDRKDIPAHLPVALQSIKNLFQTINQHTFNLLESELKIWQEKFPIDGEDSDLEYYLKVIRWLAQQAKNANKENACILRVGYGSGWRFTTGAWTEKLPSFESEIVKKARPGAYRYEQFHFPKTRRLSLVDGPFGFVKLSL